MNRDTCWNVLIKIFALAASIAAVAQWPLAHASEQGCGHEILALDVIAYEDFIRNDPLAMKILDSALHEKGIVGIKGVPGYQEKFLQFIASARAFSEMPENVKQRYVPTNSPGEAPLGYEVGKEKFKRPDGTWVVDDLKVSYYGFVPDVPKNQWPQEVDLQGPFQELGALMAETGKAVMEKIGLVGPGTGIDLEGTLSLGRMLYYKKNSNSGVDNPYWCGAHFDHGIFTAILPAFYFVDGESIPEPAEAGLFVRTSAGEDYKKVAADDTDVMMFQVGEFGQLASNDAIRATEHRVHKADGSVERYTMALFFDAPKDTVIRSHSVLTADSRYGGLPGDPCTYSHWGEESFKRYIVDEPSENSAE